VGNIVEKCLVCGGNVCHYEHERNAVGFIHGMLFDEQNAVICERCQAVYDDFGKRENRVRVFKIVQFGCCHKCGSANTKYDETYFKCLNCDSEMFVVAMNEFKVVAMGTHGWVKAIYAGKKPGLESVW